MTKLILWGVLVLAPSVAGAQGQPPIQSPQDAACRQEAGTRVFSEPNPSGLDPYVLGRRIWFECMRRFERGRGYARPARRAHRHPGRVQRIR